ncbi:antirestriction protein, partial [Escherichia coli]
MVNAVHDFQRLVTVAPGSSHLCGRRVVCGLCRASILAGLAGMQGYALPLRSPGPSFPSAVIFRSFTRSDFAVSPSNSRQPCASGCGF